MKVLTSILVCFSVVNAGWLPFWLDDDLKIEIDNSLDWYENGVFYHIYPRSFKDSNNDGVGDIKGIISKLDYIKDLGVTGIWLSPIFSSPGIDGGYDIDNYKEVNPIHGTRADLNELFAEAKRLGLKIILDFVPNHTSDKHDWFQRSIRGEEPFENFYFWRDCTQINGTITNFPNRWIGHYNIPMWSYNEMRGQCYLHQFSPAQPDLNYWFSNDQVRHEMKDIMTYWLDQGADGFRVDSANLLYESISFTAEQLIHPDADPTLYSSYLNLFNRNHENSYDVIEEMREHLDKYSREHDNVTRLLMTEAYATIQQTTAWFGNQDRRGSHIPLNFAFITDATNTSSASVFKRIVDDWMINTPTYVLGQVNWILGNHDQSRIASRYGKDKYETMAVMSMMLKGVSIVYYGDEIGMSNNYNISLAQTVDVKARYLNESAYMSFSRDPMRTPMQWDDSDYTGFCESCQPWLPINSNYRDVNVKKQMEDEKSTFKLYKSLIALRKDKIVLQKGSITTGLLDDDVFAFKRTMRDVPTIAVLINMGPRKSVSLRDLLHEEDVSDRTKATVLIANNNALLKYGDVITNINSITLGENDAVVFEVSSAMTVKISAILLVCWMLIKFFV